MSAYALPTVRIMILTPNQLQTAADVADRTVVLAPDQRKYMYLRELDTHLEYHASSK